MDKYPQIQISIEKNGYTVAGSWWGCDVHQSERYVFNDRDEALEFIATRLREPSSDTKSLGRRRAKNETD